MGQTFPPFFIAMRTKYKVREGFEGCRVHTKQFGVVPLYKATQTQLKQLFALGVPEVESYEEETKTKSYKYKKGLE